MDGNNRITNAGFCYDAAGNLLGQSNCTSYIYDAENRLKQTAGVTYTYDAAGNMTNDTANSYTYDAENRVTTVNTNLATYTYLGALRVKRQFGGTTIYVYAGTVPIAEYVGGSLTKEYIYLGSQLLATVDASLGTSYQYHDHLSTRVEADANANVTRTFGHFPFGETWYETGTASKWKFTSYERDSESGLDYADFRFDSSRLGRFMSPDPLAGSLGNPESLNRYTYVLNDPVSLVDPSGRQWVCTTTTVFGESHTHCVWVPDDGPQGPGPGNPPFSADSGFHCNTYRDGFCMDFSIAPMMDTSPDAGGVGPDNCAQPNKGALVGTTVGVNYALGGGTVGTNGAVDLSRTTNPLAPHTTAFSGTYGAAANAADRSISVVSPPPTAPAVQQVPITVGAYVGANFGATASDGKTTSDLNGKFHNINISLGMGPEVSVNMALSPGGVSQYTISFGLGWGLAVSTHWSNTATGSCP